MIDFIWNVFQQGHISSLNKKIDRNFEKEKFQDETLINSHVRLKDLEQRHEQLKLVTMAMWTLLKEHSGLMEGDLKKYIEKIDLMDGKLDGKVNMKESCDCKSFGRTILTSALACPYCGSTLNRKSAFSNS